MLFGFQHLNKLDLKKDIQKDYEMVHRHMVIFDGKESDWNVFRRYANVDLSMFKFSRTKTDVHLVLKWIKPELTIYQINTILPGDTIYQEKMISIDQTTKKSVVTLGKPIKLTPHLFTYHTYVIIPQGKQALIYVRDDSEGLAEYHIGGKTYSPLTDEIVLGKPDIELDKIMALINQ
jgi:hypothetical protein